MPENNELDTTEAILRWAEFSGPTESSLTGQIIQDADLKTAAYLADCVKHKALSDAIMLHNSPVNDELHDRNAENERLRRAVEFELSVCERQASQGCKWVQPAVNILRKVLRDAKKDEISEDGER